MAGAPQRTIASLWNGVLLVLRSGAHWRLAAAMWQVGKHVRTLHVLDEGGIWERVFAVLAKDQGLTQRISDAR
jgi:transposase